MDSDRNFIHDLVQAHHIIEREVQPWLIASGFEVLVPPLEIRPNKHVAVRHGDAFDLLLWVENEWKPIEIKRRRLVFTCVADFPFPNLIVDKINTHDRKKIKPYMYFIYNRDMNAMISLNYKDTFKYWFKRINNDSRYSSGKWGYYHCDKKYFNDQDLSKALRL